MTPTCSDCEKIGYAIPAWLLKAETDLGPKVVRDFLIEWGGVEYAIPKKIRQDLSPAAIMTSWLYSEFGHGNFLVPIGPLGRNAKIAWTIYQMLKVGHSLKVISQAVDCHTRTVSKHRKKLMLLGLIPTEKNH